MIKPVDRQLAADLQQKLIEYNDIIPMPGIDDPAAMACFVNQLVDSIRRIKYVTVIKNKRHTPQVADATSNAFDPVKGASYYLKNGDIDEACWLIFLAIHFGKNLKTKWQLPANIYGGLSAPSYWTWAAVSNDVQGFRNWLTLNEVSVKQNGKFGNHRRYQSISGTKNNGTGNTIETYVNWILAHGNHSQKFGNIIATNGGDPKMSFAALYEDMDAVKNFGRLGKFDYLAMIGKMGLADIEPNSTHLNLATGPASGAKLLFGRNVSLNTCEEWLNGLEDHLGLSFGNQVLEDAICNWQKSPTKYIHFRG